MISLKRIFCCLAICSALQANAQQRPNIIVFLVDDMGWQDTSEPFWTQTTPLNKRYRTPNMQRLARQGMKFTNAYATPVCTPTRVSLMTGMNVTRHKVTNWTNYPRDKRSDAKDSTLLSGNWNLNGMSPVPGIPNTVYATPLPKLLAQAGYYTIHCGKAHYASNGTPGADPLAMGYAVNIAGHAAGHPASYLPEKQYGAANASHGVPGLEEFYNTDVFLTEALTRKALAAIEQNRAAKKPFFLYMAQYAVHVPLEADKRFYQHYIDQGLSTEEAKYASLVEGMDKSLGDIMDYLEREGMAKNTVVMFMSDNGGLSLAPPRTPPAHTQNLPLKAGKGSVYEGGIREPMIVSWPAVIKPGTVAAQPVIIEDFFPSILEMAGVKKPGMVQQVDGQSFLPVLKNNALKTKDRLLVWHYPHRWTQGEGPGLHFFSAARKGDWKLIYDQRKLELHLYNLKDDIGEENDVAAQNPAITKALAKELTDYMGKRNVVMPISKLTGHPVEWPSELVE
ncbi:sulfatase [Chitinophaga barathri]|uniref:Sulfatase n=1 Tax=Chitinophaga barathri TaxID=1647451 RepID=A0A3N4MEV3_9BACT|nr:sulfatase [Chitinophaga barathri]RPD38620.1 sulfatase [Chitinophaga barathri]